MYRFEYKANLKKNLVEAENKRSESKGEFYHLQQAKHHKNKTRATRWISLKHTRVTGSKCYDLNPNRNLYTYLRLLFLYQFDIN